MYIINIANKYDINLQTINFCFMILSIVMDIRCIAVPQTNTKLQQNSDFLFNRNIGQTSEFCQRLVDYKSDVPVFLNIRLKSCLLDYMA